MDKDSRMDLDDAVAGHPVAMRELAEKEARIAGLEGALDRDRTGLAAALNACKREIDARYWILEGRGSYEWDDQRYRDEARWAFEAVVKIIDSALRESGRIAREALAPRGEPTTNLVVSSTRLVDASHGGKVDNEGGSLPEGLCGCGSKKCPKCYQQPFYGEKPEDAGRFEECNDPQLLRAGLNAALGVLRLAEPMTHEEDLDGHHIPRCVGCTIKKMILHEEQKAEGGGPLLVATEFTENAPIIGPVNITPHGREVPRWIEDIEFADGYSDFLARHGEGCKHFTSEGADPCDCGLARLIEAAKGKPPAEGEGVRVLSDLVVPVLYRAVIDALVAQGRSDFAYAGGGKAGEGIRQAMFTAFDRASKPGGSEDPRHGVEGGLPTTTPREGE